MIRIFVDTEFTRLPIPAEWDPDPLQHIQLISIGLIDEAGSRSFYSELGDGWSKDDCSEFTINTVIQLLESGEALRTMEQLKVEFLAWVKSFNDKVVFYCDFLVDWLFVKALLEGRSIDMDYELISYWAPDEQIAHDWMLACYFNPVTRPQHHALNDAMGLRETWLKTGKQQEF